MPLRIVPTCPGEGQSPSSKGRHGVEEKVSPIAPRTPLKPMRRTGMREQASCPTKDLTRLALQGQGLPVDPSCQSYRGLSQKQRKKTGITPYDQPGLAADDRNRYIGTWEITPDVSPRISLLAHRSESQVRKKGEEGVRDESGRKREATVERGRKKAE